MRILLVSAVLAFCATPWLPLTAQDAMEEPAFVSGRMRQVLRAGDQLRLGRLDACERPAAAAEAHVDSVFADSIVLRTLGGRLVLRAGAGEALARAYRPTGGTREPAADQAADATATGAMLTAGGAVAGAIGGLMTAMVLLLAYSPTPFMIVGGVMGALGGAMMAGDFAGADTRGASRVPDAWGQLELRRDVRAAACEFRPAP